MSRLLACCCLLLAVSAPPPAAGQAVRRCVNAQGNAVYTDRSCESEQATPREAPLTPAAGAHFIGGFAVRGCARRPETLRDGVRGALEAQDVNRLANWYHWTGTGSGTARHLMDELEAIAKRPLVAVDLVFPATPAMQGPQGFPDGPSVAQAAGPALPDPASAGPAGDTGTEISPAGHDTGAPRPGEPAPEPLALRIQQMRGSADIAAITTDFRLVRNAGCWWIEL